jgi:hypothetical protein
MAGQRGKVCEAVAAPLTLTDPIPLFLK